MGFGVWGLGFGACHSLEVLSGCRDDAPELKEGSDQDRAHGRRLDAVLGHPKGLGLRVQGLGFRV